MIGGIFKIRKWVALGLLALVGNRASANADNTNKNQGLYRDIVGIPTIFSSEDWGLALLAWSKV